MLGGLWWEQPCTITPLMARGKGGPCTPCHPHDPLSLRVGAAGTSAFTVPLLWDRIAEGTLCWMLSVWKGPGV